MDWEEYYQSAVFSRQSAVFSRQSAVGSPQSAVPRRSRVAGFYPRVSAQMTATATIVSTATVDHSEKRPIVVAIACPQI